MTTMVLTNGDAWLPLIVEYPIQDHLAPLHPELIVQMYEHRCFTDLMSVHTLLSALHRNPDTFTDDEINTLYDVLRYDLYPYVFTYWTKQSVREIPRLRIHP